MFAMAEQPWHLPKRYEQILRPLLKGKSNKSIATESRLKLHTVETYVSGILELTGAESRAELIADYWQGANVRESARGNRTG